MFLKKRLLILFFVAALHVSACGTGAPESNLVVEVEPGTMTAVPTEIPPTPTSDLPDPTPVPPTATEVPPTPTPYPRPAIRLLHGTAYDSESGQIVVYGGASSVGTVGSGSAAGIFYEDTWVFDVAANAWIEEATSLSPGPVDGTMAYDVESDRVVLFVGCKVEKVPGRPNVECIPESGTWAFDSNTSTWTNMEPEGGPTAAMGARMAYDSESDRMILFGGWDPESRSAAGAINATWAYDFNENLWTNMTPEISPPGREYHAMGYDAGSDRVILFGGRGPIPVDVRVVWTYDFNTNTWEELDSSEAPRPEGYAAMAYDANNQQMILYAGNKVWSFDLEENAWTLLADFPAPGKLLGHGMVYREDADQVFIFGGGSNLLGPTSKTWMYDPGANEWSEFSPEG